MPQETQKFKFPYFQSGDVYSPSLEEIRWKTLDENLAAIMQLLGNGVVEGWQCQGEINVSKEIVMRPGYGVVSGFAARTPEDILIDLTGRAAGNYKLILLDTPTTYYDASISYDLIPAAAPGPPGSVEVAQLTIDSSGTLLALADTRKFIGITQQIIDAINNHVHNGAPGNPAKVSLSSEVEGVLPVEHLPQIPTSKISGTINPELIKNFSHKYLTDIGDLSHLELDEIASTYDKEKFQYLGVVNAVNLLLSIIHRMDAESSAVVLKYLSNIRAILPGVTPSSWIDSAATTATVDTTNRKIVGVAGTPLSPPVPQRLTLDSVSGERGFLGPAVKKLENLEVKEADTGQIRVQLKPVSTTRYYYSDGSFYVDFNAGSVVYWDNVEFEVVVSGTDKSPGDQDGPSVTLYAKSGISKASLDAIEWLEICSSPDKSARLDNVPSSRWLRLRFDLKRGTTQTANIAIKSVKVTYSIGSSNKCSFLIYPMLDRWEDDIRVKELVNIDPYDESLFLKDITKYYEKAEYVSKVLFTEYTIVEWGSIFLSYDKPDGTAIEVYFRSSPNPFPENSTSLQWVSLPLSDVIKISKPHATYSEVRQAVSDNYIQLKFVLKKYVTSNGIEYSPCIYGISVNTYYPTYGSEYSAPFDSGVSLSTLGAFVGVSSFLSNNNSPHYPCYLTSSDQQLDGLPIYIYDIIGSYEVYGLCPYEGNGVPNNEDTSLENCELKYYEWHKSSQERGGWREQGYFMDNVTDSSIKGAISLIDQTKSGYWVSPPFKVEDASKFLGWHSIEVVGPNVSQVSAVVEFSNSENATSWVQAGVYRDPYATGVLRIPFLTNAAFYKYKWVRVKVILRS